MYLVMLTLPLAGGLAPLLTGRLIGTRGAERITVGTMGLGLMGALGVLWEVVYGGGMLRVEMGRWMDVGGMEVKWGMTFDGLSGVMCVVVTLISSQVHLFSVGYLRGDPHLPRFQAYLSIFTFWMVVLVSGESVVQLFVGWEGVGIMSYLLVTF